MINILIKFRHLILLNILDAITTYIGITYYNFKEANILSLMFFNNYGLLLGIIILKSSMLLLMWVVLKQQQNKTENKIPVIGIGCFEYTCVVFSNIYNIVL